MNQTAKSKEGEEQERSKGWKKTLVVVANDGSWMWTVIFCWIWRSDISARLCMLPGQPGIEPSLIWSGSWVVVVEISLWIWSEEVRSMTARHGNLTSTNPDNCAFLGVVLSLSLSKPPTNLHCTASIPRSPLPNKDKRGWHGTQWKKSKHGSRATLLICTTIHSGLRQHSFFGDSLSVITASINFVQISMANK
jgi:hypothetical protein